MIFRVFILRCNKVGGRGLIIIVLVIAITQEWTTSMYNSKLNLREGYFRSSLDEIFVNPILPRERA